MTHASPLAPIQRPASCIQLRLHPSTSRLRKHASRARGEPDNLIHMKLERDAVLHIAKLARVALSEEEIDTFSEQLSEIITHFDVLSTADTDGVEPTAHTLPMRNIFADDVSRPSMPQDEVLALAPNTEDGYLRVRAVLE